MLGHELAVEQGEIADLEAGDKPRQRDLRGIASSAEHAFAEERAAELHAVEAADKLAITAHLDRMGVTRLVQCEHRALELVIDPRFLARRASRDDRGEIAVVSYLEATGSKRAPKRARQVKAMERQDRPVARFDPEQVGRVAAVGHRENAGGI